MKGEIIMAAIKPIQHRSAVKSESPDQVEPRKVDNKTVEPKVIEEIINNIKELDSLMNQWRPGSLWLPGPSMTPKELFDLLDRSLPRRMHQLDYWG